MKLNDNDIRETLLDLHPMLVDFAIKSKVPFEEANDYAQETLMILWRRRISLSVVEDIKAYSVTILFNLIKKDISQKKKKREYINSMDVEDISPPDEDIDFENRQSMYCTIALSMLPPFEQRIVETHDVDEKSIRETAETLKISQYKVKTTLETAHEKMKKTIIKLLKRDGYW